MNLTAQSTEFLTYLQDWLAALPTFHLTKDIGDPHTAAIVSIDVINGFCYDGPLSSPRVALIVPPIVDLVRRCHDQGVRDVALIQEAHDETALEFREYGPHGIHGSKEAQTVPELANLPFAGEFSIIGKNTIHPALGTTFPAWLEQRQYLTTIFAVGDCTDLCTYQLAMYLKLRANAENRAQRRIIVPANCADTFDIGVATAKAAGIMPHDGDLLHAVFLYHMALNGVDIVKGVD